MKTTRILSFLLPVLGLLLMPLPSQAYTTYAKTLEWYQVKGPGERGNIVISPSEVSGIIIGQQGTAYALDSENSKVYQSQNSGLSWEDISNRLTSAGASLPASKIAVAPDSPSVVAAVTDSGTTVYLSQDSGLTWRNAGPGNMVTGTIGAIAISRQYTEGSKTLREIAIGTAVWGDSTTSGQVWVLKLGDIPFWQNQGLTIDPAHTGGEVAALAYSPGFQQDDTLLVVAATASDVAAGYQDKTWLVAGKRDTAAGTTVWDAFSGYPVKIETVTSLSAGDAPGASISATLALPSNYSSVSDTTRRAFVSYDRTPDASDDVYRINDTSVYRLNADGGAVINLASIAYSGTTSSGTLLAGDVSPIPGTKTVEMRRTSDPFTSSPTWKLATSPPSGPGNAQLSFGTGSTVYCGTGQRPSIALDESAFSISTDGGDNWQQISLMDTALTISDLVPTPDSKTIFIATYSASGPEGIWRSTLTDDGLGVYWTRQLTMDTTTNRVILRLSANYTSDYTVVAAELGGNIIAISHDRGNTWKVRQTPDNVVDMAVASNSIYVASPGGNISVTHNNAWFWEDPINTQLPDINMLTVNQDGSMLVGGNNGEAAYAPPGGTAFTTFPAGSGNIWVAADAAFQTNRIVYTGSGNQIWRINVIGGTPAQIRTISPTRQITGLQDYGGVLYGAWYDSSSGASGVERCLDPAAQITEWDTMDASSQSAGFNTPPQALKASGTSIITLWAIDTLGPALVAYDDVLAGARPVPSTPATITADPISGGNNGFTVNWPVLDDSTEYDVEIHRDGSDTLVLTAPVTSPDIAFRPDATSPAWAVDPGQLAAGDYYVRLRVRNQLSGDRIRSLWSLPVSFTVSGGGRVVATYAGPVLTSPGFGASDTPLSPAFTWAPVSGAGEYELILAHDAAFAQPVAGTPVKVSDPAWQVPGELDYGTTYFWQVRAATPQTSIWSTGSFTTIAKPQETPVVQPPPVTVSEPAPVIITSPPVTITSSTEPVTQPISQPLIWVAVGIGVALVIGLITLIVVSRR